MISSLSRRRRARQFSAFWVLPLGLLLVASAYWDLSLLLGLLPTFSASRHLRFPLGWFLVLPASEIFIFLLGFLLVVRNFNVRIWSVSCVIGLGSLVRSFIFLLSYRPLAQCWARGGPFLLVCLLFFRPADPPTQYGAMVWVIGPQNRGTGL